MARVIRGSSPVYAQKVSFIRMEPSTWRSSKLKQAMTSSNSVCLAKLTPAQLLGTSVRCFRYGNNAWVDQNGDGTDMKDEVTAFRTLRWGDFAEKADSADNVTQYFQLIVPNGANQAGTR
jgi:hypothetical protein